MKTILYLGTDPSSLTRISHALSWANAAPLAEIAPQVDKNSVWITRPCLSGGKVGRRSLQVPRKRVRNAG